MGETLLPYLRNSNAFLQQTKVQSKLGSNLLAKASSHFWRLRDHPVDEGDYLAALMTPIAAVSTFYIPIYSSLLT